MGKDKPPQEIARPKPNCAESRPTLGSAASITCQAPEIAVQPWTAKRQFRCESPFENPCPLALRILTKQFIIPQAGKNAEYYGEPKGPQYEAPIGFPLKSTLGD